MSDDVDLKNKTDGGGTDGRSGPDRTLHVVAPQQPGNDPLLGTLLGEKYRILQRIGSGGMSVVYKAKDELLNRTVAIKFLAGDIDGQSLARFQREGIAAGRLDDPHIINIHELNLSPQLLPYLVMDFVDGEPLSHVMIAEGKLPLDRALNIVTQVAEALLHAHSRGIIHRDIKPSNIILTRDVQGRDFVKLLDFGIAKLKAPDAEMQGLTKTGEVFGSPLYMSPEQCMGREVDARGDIYSLGCLFYELLSGKPPLVGDNCFQTMRKHTDEAPITLSQIGVRSDITPAVEQVAMRCLEKNPDARFPNIREFLEALASATSPAPAPIRSMSTVASRAPAVQTATKNHAVPAINLVAGVAIGALATAAVLYHQSRTVPPPVLPPRRIVHATAPLTPAPNLDTPKPTHNTLSETPSPQPKTAVAEHPVIELKKVVAVTPIAAIKAKPTETHRKVLPELVAPEQKPAEPRHSEHQPKGKPLPEVTPVQVSKKSDKQEDFESTPAKIRSVRPMPNRRTSADDLAIPKPKQPQADVAYLPPPDSKPKAAKGQKPSTNPKAEKGITLSANPNPTAEDLDAILSGISKQSTPDNAGAQEAILKKLQPRAKQVYGAVSKKYASFLETLGSHAANSGDYAFAEQTFKQAMSIYESVSGPNSVDKARCLSWFGMIKNKNGDMGGAQHLYDQSMRICRQNHMILPWIMLRCGDFQKQQKHYAQAISYYQQGLDSELQKDNVNVRKRLYQQLNDIYETLGQTDKAKQMDDQESQFLKANQKRK